MVRSRVVQTKARRGVGWRRMCPDARGRALKTAARSDARSARVALPVELPTQDLYGACVRSVATEGRSFGDPPWNAALPCRTRGQER